MSLNGQIRRLQDIMRKDVGLDGDAQRIAQLVWMLFLKVFDQEIDSDPKPHKNSRSPIPERLRWRNWARTQSPLTGAELLEFVNDDLFPTLKNLRVPDEGPSPAGLVSQVFRDAHNYMKSGELMRQVIEVLNDVHFGKQTGRHVFGDFYEGMLKDLQNAGNAGEFYTPRALTRLMIDLLAPRLGQKILDPACGTGGFLTCAIENIRRNHVRSAADESLLQECIFGVEKKPLPYLLCVTNLVLHGINLPFGIRRGNFLQSPASDSGSGEFDVIATNPPFGGTEEGDIELAFPAEFRTKETADLFLVNIDRMLKTGGQAAVVLPDSILFGEGVKIRIKKMLLERCDLHTIVRLPKGVFSPYTGINTNLLFFTKGRPTEEVWFYEHRYPAGIKSYSKTAPIRIEEFEELKRWWGARVENEVAWKVSIDEVKKRGYNLDLRNPKNGRKSRADAETLLSDFLEASEQVRATRDILRVALLESVGGRAG